MVAEIWAWEGGFLEKGIAAKYSVVETGWMFGMPTELFGVVLWKTVAGG